MGLDRPFGMNGYEEHRWNQIQDWHEQHHKGLGHLVPASVKKTFDLAGDRVAEIWEKIPGNDQIEQVLAKTIQGSFHFAIDTAAKTISEPRVTRKVMGRPGSYTELSGLPLNQLDRAAPSLKVSRSLLAAAHGAAAGFLAGGSVAAGAASGGMSALPSAGVVAATAAADAGAVAIGSIQAAGLVGAHYGYDPTSAAEHAMMMSVLGGTLMGDAARVATFRQIRQLALDLAAKKTVDHLSRKRLYQIMLKLYGAMLLKTTKRNVARGLPVIGIAIGAGTNYKTLRDTVERAAYNYPERWLLDKYNAPSAEVIDIEVLEREVDEAIDADDAGVIDKLEWKAEEGA